MTKGYVQQPIFNMKLEMKQLRMQAWHAPKDSLFSYLGPIEGGIIEWTITQTFLSTTSYLDNKISI